jgi:hypothetical protein
VTVERVAVRVAPPRALRETGAAEVPHRALLAREPLAVLGGEREPALVTSGVRVDRRTCFGPRGVALLGPDGPVVVCDTGHHRVLIWARRADHDGAPADWVIGQPDFESEGRNGKGPITGATVDVPTGVCPFGERGLAVADAWNHRILVWKTLPRENNVPADLVLGQRDFASAAPNRGRATASADGLHWPYGVACAGGRLLVADSENRRVLVWNALPTENGQPADLVLGQASFDCRDENGGRSPDAATMRWPHAIAMRNDDLALADAGNNRILVWTGFPTTNGQPADVILGQPSGDVVDHNQSLYWPRAHTLNMPYGLAWAGDWLVVADTANSRLVGWHASDLATGASARVLAGQPHFHEKGDNRWGPAVPDSFCWPYGVANSGALLAVADSGNNRVSLWRHVLCAEGEA